MKALKMWSLCNRKFIKINHRLIRYNHQVRVRFAPSPTGHLHLGGLRTALYNYLFARASNGTFILRIEDTDRSRLVEESASKIISTLEWMGIRIDEGPNKEGKFGPYVQSQRLNFYRESVEKLLENGSAYRCFCSELRLDLVRKDAAKRNQVPRYDNHCRSLSTKELNEKLAQCLPHVVRLKLEDEITQFNDLVYGPFSMNLSLAEGDPILMKSDGYPTYHLANVVDDHFMQISHVLRGVEWQVSTAKHLLLYKALDFEPPKYAHLPLIINKDGTKLSKRQGDIHVEHFKNKGYHPEALLNFVMQVGGGCGKLTDQIYTLDQFVELFSLEKVNNNPGKLEMDRLDHANRMSIYKSLENEKETKLMVETLRKLVENTFQQRLANSKLQSELLSDKNIERILRWSKKRIFRLQDLVEANLEFVWTHPDNMNSPHLKHEAAESTIFKVYHHLKTIDGNEFVQDRLSPLLKQFAQTEGVKFNWLMKLLRVSLSNLQEGPSVAEMMEILGKEDTLNRLYKILKNSKNQLKDVSF